MGLTSGQQQQKYPASALIRDSPSGALPSRALLREAEKHRSEKKAHSELEGSDTWRKLHKSNKHSKERFHHHEKHGGEKELKNIQKHALGSVSRHEASLQGDTLVNHRAAHSKRQRDPHSTDIHLQDLAHPAGQHHGHAQPHHEDEEKRCRQEKTRKIEG
ncbi:hypothetical protein HPB50_019001 [Hyalomma asiaticum]|uniref:Uncharacterized protein n=1 Tax=Hyalomma asiaticum TaxID=266040 RepID=A0ACB7T3G8_HYAAI|nr:hypothetical protein HPB50_019001 [Hyalomma asiaticum]